MSRASSTRRSASEWQEILDECDRSGLAQRAFCEKMGLVPSTFHLWRRKLRSAKPSPAFVPVTPVVETSATGWSIEIELPDGTMARLHS